jgi:RNA polymerase sigma factor (sigma-70 family)
MLDIDTIKSLHDLTARTLYDAEIAHLPERSRAEVEALIDRARQGDKDAREAFILSCLPHALGVARFIYYDRRLLHDDLLDLAQVGSLRMLEQLDKALSTSAPAAFIRGIARRAILDYCVYHSGLIDKPEYSLKVLEKLNPHPATVESLDAPLHTEKGQRIRIDMLSAPVAQPEPDEKQQEKRYDALYKAIHTLPRDQQSALVRLYGLFGQPMETAPDIGRPELIRNRAYEARNKLRKWLSEYLERMLAESSNEEEEA